MNIDLIESVTKHYEEGASESDTARLDFFEELYRLQHDIGGLVSNTSIYGAASPEQLEELYWSDRSILSELPAPIDPALYADALERIAAHLSEHAGLEDAAAQALAGYDWRAFAEQADLALAGTDPTAFLDGVLSGIDSFGISDDLPANVFAMVPAMALRPFLEGPAEKILEVVDAEKGRYSHDAPVTCPVCGSQATASFVGQSAGTAGRGRMQYCGTCGTLWPYERIRCGVCGSKHKGHFHYYNLEGDSAHRIQTCEDCGNYERVVFQDDLEVPVCMEVEDVVMARLDKVALDPRFRKEQ